MTKTQAKLLALASLVCLTRAQAPSITLTLAGGPASYTMTIPTNGWIQYTYNGLSVSEISTTDPAVNILGQCTFYTTGSQTVTAESPTVVHLGPPQPVYGISCGGGDGNERCLFDYESCVDRNGQMIGTCCSGYCAASKCRPTQ